MGSHMANRLFKSEMGKLFPALGQLDKAGVTDEMWEGIGDKDGVYANVVCEAIMTAMNPSITDVITVPAHAIAEELVIGTIARLHDAEVTLVNSNDGLIELVRKDLKLVSGKRCKVLVHAFDHPWGVQEARDFQIAKGFDGNAAAFCTWVAKTRFEGESISIPNDHKRLFKGSQAVELAPYFYKIETIQQMGCAKKEAGLGLESIKSATVGRCSLVSFSVM
jgi:hypothetical protein